MIESKETLLLTLAKILVGKQVDSKAITASLKLICKHFSFDSGLVYEIDQYNCFHLKENVSPPSFKALENFILDTVSPQYRRQLAEDTLTYIFENPQNNPSQAKALQFFNVDSMLIFSVVDANTRINGLIFFLNQTFKPHLSEKELESLTLLIPLLGRYAETRVYQNRITFTQTSFDSILDNTGIDIYVNDFNTHDILYVNKSMALPYGGVKAFDGKKCWEILFPGQSGPCEFCPQTYLIDESGNPTKVYSWDYQRAFDGAWFRVFSAAFPWVDGRLAHVVSSADITDTKEKEALIAYMANYDALTNLPNRRMLISDCETRIDNATTSTHGFLLFFDIDGFKAINDTYGHNTGDEFLIQLGKFFTDIPMLKDAIYRNGGDEFVALVSSPITKDNLRYLGNFIHERFKKPWVLDKGQVYCNTSIGIACYPEDGSTAEILLQKADAAMYYAKQSGGGRLCFFDDLD